MNRRIILLAYFVAFTSCGNSAPEETPVLSIDMGTQSQDSPIEKPVAARCIANVIQSGSYFVDRTIETGLQAMQSTGTRISVADINNDGYADLAMRRVGNVANDFADGGTRTFWMAENNGDGTFSDVTQTSGLVRSRYLPDDTLGRPSEVVIFGDVDNDGDLDAFSGFSNDGSIGDGTEILFNDGNGKFELGGVFDFHARSQSVALGGATFTDVDRDGRLDLWLAHGMGTGSGQDSLFVQNADGTFTDRTTELGLATSEWSDVDLLNTAQSHTNAWSGLAADLNGDGTPELLSASYGRAPNHLWRSSDAGWVNYSVASGYAFDENQDWTLSHSARCYCQSAPTATGCANSPSPEFSCDSIRGWDHDFDTQPFRLGGNSGTTSVGDLDNDGDLDLLTNEIVHFDVGGNSDPSELLYNDGTGTFSRPGNSVTGIDRPRSGGWNDGDITGALLDFDNDGRLDVLVSSTDYAGTRVWLWHQLADGNFEMIDVANGIDHTSSHGVAVADFDRDGDLDVVLGHSPNRCSSGAHCYPAGQRHVRYFENTMGQDSNWLQIRLEGATGTNRSAIGAQVTVRYSNGETQVVEIGGGHGHYGMQHEMVAHFGLGDDCEVDVSVRWPNGELQTERATLGAGYRWFWKQGDDPIAGDS